MGLLPMFALFQQLLFLAVVMCHMCPTPFPPGLRVLCMPELSSQSRTRGSSILKSLQMVL
eukprot:5607562-Amphidinium_carterae.1